MGARHGAQEGIDLLCHGSRHVALRSVARLRPLEGDTEATAAGAAADARVGCILMDGVKFHKTFPLPETDRGRVNVGGE